MVDSCKVKAAQPGNPDYCATIPFMKFDGGILEMDGGFVEEYSTVFIGWVEASVGMPIFRSFIIRKGYTRLLSNKFPNTVTGVTAFKADRYLALSKELMHAKTIAMFFCKEKSASKV